MGGEDHKGLKGRRGLAGGGERIKGLWRLKSLGRRIRGGRGRGS